MVAPDDDEDDKSMLKKMSKSTEITLKANETSAQKQSLFERVTGLSSSTGDVAETVVFEPKVAKPPMVPESIPSSAPAETEVKSQLGGMDKVERQSSPQGEADLLDIPAFLRRQAN